MKFYYALLFISSIAYANYGTIFVGQSIVLNEGDLFETISYYSNTGESDIVFTLNGREHREGTGSTDGANNVIIVGPGSVTLEKGDGSPDLGRLSYKLTRSFDLNSSETTTVSIPASILSYDIQPSTDQRFQLVVEGSNDKSIWTEVFRTSIGKGREAFYKIRFSND